MFNTERTVTPRLNISLYWRRLDEMKPTVLIATTCKWLSTARLAMALANAGFVVDAVCPPGHVMDKTSCVRRLLPYRGLLPIASFSRAIAATSPDLIVPSDDLVTQHLHELYSQQNKRSLLPEPTGAYGHSPWTGVCLLKKQ